ncbi:MAG: hypothetical protein LBT62_01165 [Deltaproteobacteria bacterium]|nr:hypothetical protein [Deltaproteobacteria bacterium]
MSTILKSSKFYLYLTEICKLLFYIAKINCLLVKLYEAPNGQKIDKEQATQYRSNYQANYEWGKTVRFAARLDGPASHAARKAIGQINQTVKNQKI